ADRRQRRRPGSAADQDQQVHRAPLAARRQEVARAVRDPDAQAAARHPRADAADAGRAHEARPVGGRRRRDQDLIGTRRHPMQIDIVNIEGKKVGSADLADAVFGAKVKDYLLWELVKAQQAAKRAGTHDTKTRDEVRGGGKKPYKQKGTGNARQGSSRARTRTRCRRRSSAPRWPRPCRCARRRRSWWWSTPSRSTARRPSGWPAS